MAQSLVHHQTGTNLCQLVSHPIPSISSSDSILVRFLAAPVNRVDLMVLAGQYPVKPKYTATPSSDNNGEGTSSRHPIPGFDGCGIVESSTSPLFTQGDLVLPRDLGLGTWRTHAALPATALLKLPREVAEKIDPVDAALIRSGALIARLLLDNPATPLQAGDCVIISAGTSTVAQFLVQLARRRGVRVILVIRDRAAGLAAVKTELLALGAEAVLSESELEREVNKPSSSSQRLLPKGPIVLALDSVFGRVGELLAAALSPGGKFVLVGLLAGPSASIQLTTQYLFARQLSFLPFRGSEHLKRMGDERAEELIGEIARMFVDGTLKRPRVRVVEWGNNKRGEVEEALRWAVDMANGEEAGHVKTVWKPT
ncbi:putative trans-2-enoyl-CoA reductase mitochondrial precursor [Triangularia setosa]|uniref:enoyl-[acyl-carrier-protein] reductase n=1 Tax=Triangularia setosa TaxID=2587417 RepID=A0AAN7A3T4_9PEZI|nr:putative trans-2-enoyl-CoA reductase mitochondrial precursor [Podospora setosa]